MVRREVEAGGRRRKSRDALTSHPEIERLLRAASAPASPRELAGEHAAVDLFARARLVREAAVAAAVPVRSPRTGLKAAAASAAAVVVMSSGVAFAATGHVPFADKLGQITRSITRQSSDDAPDTGSRNDRTHGPQHNGDKADPNGPKAAALFGLCRAYAHGQKVTHGHALETRPFTALVLAAGGADQVDGFCATVVPKGHVEATHPAHPSHPVHPTHPTTGPSGEPTDHPSHPSHPTQPTHPSHPSHPSSPTHKPKPTQASDPTHPTKKPHPSNTPKPSKSAQPSHTSKPHPTH